MPRLDRLWYEIDARTKDFDENIGGAKKKLQDFTDYAGKHPGVVLGALGVAFAAVAFEAVKMAAEIDESMRKLKAVMPSVTGDIASLRKEIADLSLTTPKTQKELAETAIQIAKLGVSTPEELKQRLRAVAEISEATSLDMNTIADGLNTVGDAFQLSGQHAIDALKEIFATAQGKVPLDELFRALERGGSVLSSLGVKATDAAQAMATLRDAGVMPRKVGTGLTQILDFTEAASKQLPNEQDPTKRAELEKYLSIVTKTNIETNGLIPVIKQLSDAFGNEEANLRHLGLTVDAANAVLKIHDKAVIDTRTETEKLEDAEKKVAAAAYENSQSMQALSEKIHNNLNSALIELGTKILPIVNAAFQTMLDMMNSGSRSARELGDAMTRIKAGRPDEGPADAGINRILSYDLTKGRSLPQSDMERVVQSVQDKGAEAVFGGMSPKEMEHVLRYLQSFKSADQDVKDTITDLNNLILATQNHQKATDAATEAEKQAAITAAKQTDAIQAQNRARDEQRRIMKETSDKIIALGEELNKAVAGTTPSRVDDKIAEIAAIEAKMDAIRKSGGVIPPSDMDMLVKLLGQIDKLKTEETAAVRSKFDELMGTATTSIVDNLTASLETLKIELSKMPGFTQDMINQVVAAKQAVINANKNVLAGFGGEVNTTDPAQMMSSMRTLTDERQRLVDLESQEVPLTASRAVYTNRIKEIDAQILKLQEENKNVLADIAETEKKRIENVSRVVTEIQNAVGGALQLAQAFGLMDSSTAQVITQLSNIGSMLPNLVAAFDAFKDKTGGIGGIIGAGLPIVGGLASVFGGIMSAQHAVDAEHNRLVAQNTNALRDLSKNVGDLARISVTGTEYGRVQNFLKNPGLAGLGSPNGPNGVYGITQDAQNRQIGAVLDALGMSAHELVDFMKQFGITPSGHGGKILADDINKLAEAMKNAEITKFADTFEGQMNQMDAAINLFDLSKPIDQFHQLQKALDAIQGGGGTLANVLKGFDLTTTTGVNAAEKALQDLFDKMQAGTLSPTDLGGMTPQQFLDAITRTMGILRAQGASPGLGGTGGFNVSQTITQVTGERMSALLSTANVFAEMTARNTGAIVAALGGNAALPSVSPPSLPPTQTLSTGAMSGGMVTIQNMPITVNLGGNVDMSSAQKIGAGIAAATVDAIDREMASRQKWNLRARGRPVTR